MKLWKKLAALFAVMTLALTACSGEAGSGATVENGDKKSVKIAVFNGWDEGIAASELWKSLLTDKGYEVELVNADPAAAYSGLSTGDYDLVLDTWLPLTHKSYIEKYGKDMIDLGYWYDDAKLTIAVNKDAPIDSLDELAANADKFQNRLVGIEPGAGLTEVTKDKVIPEYGLDKMDYVTSSTPAMLAELKSATEKKENIVVTLWRPHWAYDAFPIKDLKDPKQALGEAEKIHSFARTGFDKDYPKLTEWIKNFSMSSEQLFSLENAMFNSGKDSKDYADVVKQWSSENSDYTSGLTK